MTALVFFIVVVLAGGALAAVLRQPGTPRTEDAEAEARRWVERLGAGVAGLSTDGDRAATQALADAAERHTAASVQLAQARSTGQYALAGQTAIEGLHYIRAARTALGIDPGPPIPTLAPVAAGNASAPSDATPYYYPGGMVDGRPVAAGWYSTPWWKTALVAGAAGVGGALLMDTLLDGFHHPF